MSRASYYLQKFSRKAREKGISIVMKETLGFLWRRKFFLEFVWESIEYRLLSHFREPIKTVKAIVKETALNSRKVLIYANYDLQSEILPHVVDQVRAFEKLGYDIVFVSTSPQWNDSEFRKIDPWVKVAVHRKNQGYDFTSWKVGFWLVEDLLESLTSFILMNDSCLGPYFDISPLIAEMERQKGVVYGITKSYEISEYIQSYFYHFGENVIKAGWVSGFIRRIRILNSKWAIVRFFEIGGSMYLRKKGIALKALIDPSVDAIKTLMLEAGQTEPAADPLGKRWLEMKLSPFYKRSNLKGR